MSETRPDAPRYLREQDAPPAENAASVNVTDLLARFAEQAEELAEAKVRQENAEAALRKATREMNKERKAHSEAQTKLETDCSELEAEVVRERSARTAAQAELTRVQDRVASLQQQLQIARARLQQGGAEAEQQRPWWSRLGS
jgi:chromosome segregation ATPase